MAEDDHRNPPLPVPPPPLPPVIPAVFWRSSSCVCRTTDGAAVAPLTGLLAAAPLTGLLAATLLMGLPAAALLTGLPSTPPLRDLMAATPLTGLLATATLTGLPAAVPLTGLPVAAAVLPPTDGLIIVAAGEGRRWGEEEGDAIAEVVTAVTVTVAFFKPLLMEGTAVLEAALAFGVGTGDTASRYFVTAEAGGCNTSQINICYIYSI